LGSSARFPAFYRRLYTVFLGDGNVVDSAVSHCWLLEACDRARAGHLRPAILVACFSARDVHCRNVDVCECYWDAVSAHHSAYCCLYRDVSLVHHVQCYASQTWKVLSCVWTTKDFACDASTLERGDHSWADLFALAHAETQFLWEKRPNDWWRSGAGNSYAIRSSNVTLHEIRRLAIACSRGSLFF